MRTPASAPGIARPPNAPPNPIAPCWPGRHLRPGFSFGPDNRLVPDPRADAAVGASLDIVAPHKCDRKTTGYFNLASSFSVVCNFCAAAFADGSSWRAVRYASTASGQSLIVLYPSPN